jgi:hypothetical protein
MTIAPGALVLTKQTSTVLHVVVKQSDDHRRWLLRSKATDAGGRSTYIDRTVGEGDITIVKPPITVMRYG